jgi:hypothetical protein
MKEEREKPIINCCLPDGAKSTAFCCSHRKAEKTAEALSAVFLCCILSFSGAEFLFVCMRRDDVLVGMWLFFFRPVTLFRCFLPIIYDLLPKK